jgi:hypothetical protein
MGMWDFYAKGWQPMAMVEHKEGEGSAGHVFLYFFFSPHPYPLFCMEFFANLSQIFAFTGSVIICKYTCFLYRSQ